MWSASRKYFRVLAKVFRQPLWLLSFIRSDELLAYILFIVKISAAGLIYIPVFSDLITQSKSEKQQHEYVEVTPRLTDEFCSESAFACPANRM